MAIQLNNLAQLLEATNRLAEAEPLMRRALATLIKFTLTMGHVHPPSFYYFGQLLRPSCSGRWGRTRLNFCCFKVCLLGKGVIWPSSLFFLSKWSP